MSSSRLATSLFVVVAVILPGGAAGQFPQLGWGGAASGFTAATAFQNPAALVLFEEPEYLIGGAALHQRYNFQGSSAQYIGPRVEGGSQSDTRDSKLSAFHARPLEGGRWFLGFGIFEPFGRNLQYDRIIPFVKEEWNGLNFGPAVGFKVTDKFSVGATLNIQWAEFWCNMKLPELGPDGFSEGLPAFLVTYGDDWEVGYRVGLLYQLRPGTRIGLNYVSVLDQLLTGYSSYNSPTMPDVRGGGYSIGFPIPPSYTLSFHHDVNERWAVLGSVKYIDFEPYWDDVLLDGLVAPAPFESLPATLGIESNWTYSLAAKAQINDAFGLIVGYEDAESITVDEWRSVKDNFAGSSAIGFTARWSMSETIRLDFGYRKYSNDDAHIVNPTGAGELGNLESEWDLAGIFLNVRPKGD